MRKQVTTTMEVLQNIMSTKISKVSGSRFRTTFPRALARAISLADRDEQAMKFGIRCTNTGPTLEVSVGPDVQERGANVMSPIIHSSGQVEIELPRFQSEAWNLENTRIDWPDEDGFEVADDGSVTILAPLLDWEPKHEVDMFAASGGFAHGSSVTKSGDERSNIESHFPISLAEAVGLDESQTRAEITFDCVDGRKVMVATPTEKSRSELRNSVSVNLAGARKRQARFNAGRIAIEFGFRDTLEEQSVPLRWFQQDDQLIAFTRTNGSDSA